MYPLHPERRKQEKRVSKVNNAALGFRGLDILEESLVSTRGETYRSRVGGKGPAYVVLTGALGEKCVVGSAGPEVLVKEKNTKSYLLSSKIKKRKVFSRRRTRPDEGRFILIDPPPIERPVTRVRGSK